MANGGIFALDIATSCGFAVALPGKRIFSGTIIIRGASHGAKFSYFHTWLTEQCTVHDPRVLGIEAPLVKGQEAFLLMGLAAVAELVADQLQIPQFNKVHIGIIKKHWANSGAADKAAMIAASRARGLNPQTDDEADAQALLDYLGKRHKMALRYPNDG